MTAPRPLGPADHAFVSALSALSLAVCLSAEDEALYVDVASGVADRVNCDSSAMQRLFVSFTHYKAARMERSELPHVRYGLAVALHEFHRWRMGAAVGVLEETTRKAG